MNGKEFDSIVRLLISSCENRGLRFKSFTSYLGKFMVFAHDPSLAGREPNIEYSRDGQDYLLSINAWNRKGMVCLAIDVTPMGAINLALDYLDKSYK